MTDLTWLDSKVRGWLKHAPLSAIVILLKAIHHELESRNRAHSSLGPVSGQTPRMVNSSLPRPSHPRALSYPGPGLP